MISVACVLAFAGGLYCALKRTKRKATKVSSETPKTPRIDGKLTPSLSLSLSSDCLDQVDRQHRVAGLPHERRWSTRNTHALQVVKETPFSHSVFRRDGVPHPAATGADQGSPSHAHLDDVQPDVHNKLHFLAVPPQPQQRRPWPKLNRNHSERRQGFRAISLVQPIPRLLIPRERGLKTFLFRGCVYVYYT